MFCCHTDAQPVPRPHLRQLLLLSLIRQRFTCHSASLQSIASSIGSHGTWLRGMPQRVQFIKLNTTVALCSSCSTGQWQLLPCSRMLYISFVSFSAVSAVSAVSVAVFAVLFAISNRMYVLPYPASSVPLCHYAICRRVPFPDLCNAMHVPHFCSKTCRTCMWRMAATKIPQKVPQMLNLKHVARCTDCSATVLIEFATATATATV